MVFEFVLFCSFLLLVAFTFDISLVESSSTGTRPHYVFDHAGIINDKYENLIDTFLRQLDDSTTAEVIVYTIPGFIGHDIKKDGQEIQDRDTLTNYIFNELYLDGIKGIGKTGKDNGVLVLFSSKPDTSGGSMRIEVGKGLEGNITDGIAGEILDTYLVPVREAYVKNGNITLLDQGILNTVISLGHYIGYSNSNPNYKLTPQTQQQSPLDYLGIIMMVIVFLAIFSLILRRRGGRNWRRWGGYGGMGWYGGTGGGLGSGWGSGGTGGGFGSGGTGGGGYSSGGGAGR